MFSVVDAVLLEDLPLDAPERVVAIWHHDLDRPSGRSTVSPGNLEDWRRRVRSFTDLAAYSFDTANLTGGDQPQRVRVCELVGGFFDVLRPRPVLGRLPTAADATPGAEPVAALGHHLWRQAFAGAADVVGRVVLLDGRPVTVVGVAPPGVGGRGTDDVDVFLPGALSAELAASRSEYFLRVVGRLHHGVGLERAQAELDLVMTELRREHPRANENTGARIEPLHEATTASARGPLLALFGAVVLVLLIACVNLAHLLLARMRSRERDLAVRRALGASSQRLVRSALVEAIVLAAVGGAGGALLARLLLGPLLSLLPTATPRLAGVEMDAGVLAFAVLLSLGTGVLFGILPAARLPRAAVLRGGATGDRSAVRGGRVLVVAEISFAVVLLVCAVLLVRSVREMRRVELGFRTEGTLTFGVRTAGEGYDGAARARFFERLLGRLEQLPGVVAAGASINHPASENRNSAWMRPAATPIEDGESPPWTGYNAVTPGFFESLEVSPVRGRLFRRGAGAGERVAVVNEEAQRRFWPDREALGERFGLGPPGEFLDDVVVVGVVPDLREGGLVHDPSPMVYFPYGGRPHWSDLVITVRTATDPVALIPAATEVVHALDASLPVYGARASTELVEAQVGPARALATLLSTFAVLGVSLAGLGVAGLLADSVARRRREIGIRMALGASAGRTVRGVLGEGLVQVGAGAAIGLAISIAAAHVLRGLLFQVSVADLPALGATLGIVLLVAGAATAIPAWRAARVQPSTVLRGDA
ncbi:MAG TPA: ABC transporter permease [Thermoanaerobaculia bacterium]|nr:ABC transporter permease [Thermoanaerobaculia bacterium]